MAHSAAPRNPLGLETFGDRHPGCGWIGRPERCELQPWGSSSPDYRPASLEQPRGAGRSPGLARAHRGYSKRIVGPRAVRTALAGFATGCKGPQGDPRGLPESRVGVGSPAAASGQARRGGPSPSGLGAVARSRARAEGTGGGSPDPAGGERADRLWRQWGVRLEVAPKAAGPRRGTETLR